MEKREEEGSGSRVIDFLKVGTANARIVVYRDITGYEPSNIPINKFVLVLGVLKKPLFASGNLIKSEYQPYTYEDWAEAVSWMHREIQRTTGQAPESVRDATLWFSRNAELIARSAATDDYKDELLRLLSPLSKAIGVWNNENLPLEVAS